MDFWGIAGIALAALGFTALGAAVMYGVLRRAVRDGLREAYSSLSPVGPAVDLPAPAPQIAWDHPSVVNGTPGLAPVRSIASARAGLARAPRG